MRGLPNFIGFGRLLAPSRGYGGTHGPATRDRLSGNLHEQGSPRDHSNERLFSTLLRLTWISRQRLGEAPHQEKDGGHTIPNNPGHDEQRKKKWITGATSTQDKTVGKERSSLLGRET